MAIQTAGQNPAKAIKIRVENQASFELPKDIEAQIGKILDFLPTEHQRGLERFGLWILSTIRALKIWTFPSKAIFRDLSSEVGNQNAWLEVSMGALYSRPKVFPNAGWRNLRSRQSRRIDFLARRSALLFDAPAFNQKHKSRTADSSIRRKNLKTWSERQQVSSKRAKFFKPFSSIFEKWAKWLEQKRRNHRKKPEKRLKAKFR